MLQVSSVWALPIPVTVKRAAVSSKEGWRLAAVTVDDPSNSFYPVHSILHIEGFLKNSKTQFLIDSGAAISVIQATVLPEGTPISGREYPVKTVAANGQPLDIIGQMEVSVSFTNDFHTSHKFLVVKDLSIPVILGSDF